MEPVSNAPKLWITALLILMLGCMAGGYLYYASGRKTASDTIAPSQNVTETLPSITVESNPVQDKLPELNPIDKANPFQYKNPFE